jgi:hypothetical protein
VNRYTWIKLGIAATGLIVWGYGQRVDDATIRLIGIVLLAIAVILRLLPKRLRGSDYPKS